jgi:hypothetical protein
MRIHSLLVAAAEAGRENFLPKLWSSEKPHKKGVD